MVNKDYQYQSI